ncbi:hypothetical protein L1987_47782 [Smallanthus sonchifolius]|uniref:Uncharacterized protein n=1 Tax=Smallanthus sonchifolius TaxID=185202 RepID=A0ACB9FQ63_9ASTR|nr:hypothetical protein L1987_47782 [Smallanthus sonchifolius]
MEPTLSVPHASPPYICYSTVTQKLATKKDVIEHTINKTKDTIEANLHTITTLTTASNLTKRARTSLHECLDMEAEQLDTVIHNLREYPAKKSLSQYADDLKTLMSATITNKETCNRIGRDITFQNTAGPQAVALRVASDLSAFYKCGMEGYQDTLYVHSNRQFYVKCFVTGTVDFIFGNAAVVSQFCEIMARKPNPNQLNSTRYAKTQAL